MLVAIFAVVFRSIEPGCSACSKEFADVSLVVEWEEE